MIGSEAEERREAVRYKVKVVIDRIEAKSISLLLEYGEGEGYVYDFEGDISEKGIFVATDSPFRKGDEIEVMFSLPDSIEVIKARGRVVWIGKGGPGRRKGMGVEIVEIDENGRKELNRFLEKAELKDAR